MLRSYGFSTDEDRKQKCKYGGKVRIDTRFRGADFVDRVIIEAVGNKHRPDCRYGEIKPVKHCY